jgi:hypothetical protein
METGDTPRHAAATAWFAPLPPQAVEKSFPMTVSPRTGKMSVVEVRSWLADPTTKTELCSSANADAKESDMDRCFVVKKATFEFIRAGEKAAHVAVKAATARAKEKVR